MDISAVTKSLVIIYYLASLHFIKTAQLMVKDGNIQKNIRHSRSRPYYLIDNRHISESATYSPNVMKDSISPKSLASRSHLINQTIESSDKNFLYFLEAGDAASFRRAEGTRQANHQQMIDTPDRKVTNPTPAAHRFDGNDINKSLIGVENSPADVGGGGNIDNTPQHHSIPTQNNNNSSFYNSPNETATAYLNANATFMDLFTHRSQNKDISEENKKDEGSGVKESLKDSVNVNESDENVERLKEVGEEFPQRSGHVDIVTRFLRIVESQHLLGENCTAGTALNLGEGVVDRYAQERFRVEADVAVNRANMLTRLWKSTDHGAVMSEYFLHASVFSMVEFDDDIFAAGNCYDQYQYKDYILFCPFAFRLPEGQILVKDLAVEYKYLSNTSEWFYKARMNAENVIKNYNQFSRGKRNEPSGYLHVLFTYKHLLSVLFLVVFYMLLLCL